MKSLSSLIKWLLFLMLAIDAKFSWSQSDSMNSSGKTKDKECMLYSDEYKSYIYAAHMFFGYMFNRRAFSYSILNPLTTFNEDVPASIWYFRPVASKENTFFLVNKKFANEHLYASTHHAELFGKKERRQVFVGKPKQGNTAAATIDTAYMWRMQRVGRNVSVYQLWNVKYLEPMYVSTMHDKLRKNLFTWYARSPFNNQFNFLLRCRNQDEPYIS